MKIQQTIVCMLFGSLFLNSANAQADEVKFQETIKDDSVVLYFNDDNRFTEKQCATFRRYTSVDENGNFSKFFTDVDGKEKKLAQGYYSGGMKNGFFEIYYSNGNVKCNGYYHDNLPIATWHYYYPDSKPERTIAFLQSDTSIEVLLTEFFDDKGRQRVKDGNGLFKGIVWENSVAQPIIAEGNIVNGSPDGKWTGTQGGMQYSTEYFKEGIFLKGSRAGTSFLKPYDYTNASKLNDFFYGQYFARLEEFQTKACPRPSKAIDSLIRSYNKQATHNVNNLGSFANDAIREVFDRDAKNGNYKEYLPGENKLIISFTVNDKGVPEDFKQVTSWGDQYFNPLTSVLRMHAKLTPGKERSYFTLTIEISDGTTMGFRYNISNN